MATRSWPVKFLGYDPSKMFKQSSHTLDNIFAALERVFPRPEAALAAKQRIAEYMVLDALIGNTDRHHENWGLLVERTPKNMIVSVAPSFDHASSLGRELLDESIGNCRARLLKENRVGQYSEKAPGAIYWTIDDKKGVSPLELVRRAAQSHPELFRRAFSLLDKLEKEHLECIVRQVPLGWMSDVAREFAIKLTCYNVSQLRDIAL